MDSALLSQLLILNHTLICYLICKQKEQKRKAYRVNPYLRQRDIKGRFETDFSNMVQNPKIFKENFHMDEEMFERLVDMVTPYLLPKRGLRKDLISRKQKLAIVLEFLASGDLQRHVSSCYRISPQHFGTIIDDVCNALIKELRFVIPQWNAENMMQMAEEFENKWNFPNCLGAIDGKHVRIKCPKNSGSLFYNYKGFYSIVILDVCDANYRFSYLDVGAYGSEGDANVFKNSSLGRRILQDTFFFRKIPIFVGLGCLIFLSEMMPSLY